MSPSRSPAVERAKIDRAVALRPQSLPHFDQSTGRQPRWLEASSVAPLKQP